MPKAATVQKTRQTSTSSAPVRKPKKLTTVDPQVVRHVGIARWARAVEAAGHGKGMSRADVAAYLDVAIGYFNVLLAGGGKSQKVIGHEVLEKSADLLDTSVLSVYLQSGMLKTQDLYQTTNFQNDLDVAYNKMSSNVNFCSYLPDYALWNQLPINVRYGYVLMYDQATLNQTLDKLEILAQETEKGA